MSADQSHSRINLYLLKKIPFSYTKQKREQKNTKQKERKELRQDGEVLESTFIKTNNRKNNMKHLAKEFNYNN